MDKRVVSKSLFNFTYNGILDEDIRIAEDNKPAPDAATMKVLGMLQDKNDDVFTKAMRMIVDASVMTVAHHPGHKKGIEGCLHTEIKVPTNHDGEYDVTVLVHTPKSMYEETCSPAIIYAHGGGVAACSAQMFKPYLSNLANECGVVVFNVDYRLAPETKCPNNMLDFYSVVKYISSHATSLHIDPTKIAIAGESGGGYICMSTMVLLAQRDESSLVKLAMPNIPMISDYCFTDTAAMTKEERADAVMLRRVWKNLIASDFEKQKSDPLLFPSKAPDDLLQRMPPTIIWSAEFDMFLTETLRIANRLRACGRLLELAVLPGIKHASNFNPAFACYQRGLDAYKLAVKEYLMN